MISLDQISEKWNVLRKAVDAAATPKAAPAAVPTEEPTNHPEPTPDMMKDVKYGYGNIKGVSPSTADLLPKGNSIGGLKIGKKDYVVRHGARGYRTAVEHEMSKLLDAEHMLPEHSYNAGLHHHDHYGKDTFNPNDHGGTSLQEHVEGEPLDDDTSPKSMDKLAEQWKNGDIHKLWALHYISNNRDQHAGNFTIGKDGLKAFDSDLAFHELPDNYSLIKGPDGTVKPRKLNDVAPDYLHPFLGTSEGWTNIPHSHGDVQADSKKVNEWANDIQPEAFKPYGEHAMARAEKVKQAMTSADPTSAMKDLWNSHLNENIEEPNGNKTKG